MIVGELFAGIGGIGLGLERCGLEIKYQVEIDPQRRSVLGYHWPNVLRMENVCEITGSDLPPVDIITGGFPCQDISVAGRRKGLAGERSGLFYEFMRIISECSPRWILIENVDGLRSSNKRRDLGTIFRELGNRDYWWTSRVLDSQYFGVPQRRRRIFIVGYLGGPCRPEVLFEPESLQGNIEKSGKKRPAVTTALTGSLGSGGADDNKAQAGHLITGAVSAKWSKGTGGPAGDEVYNLIADPVIASYSKGSGVNDGPKGRPQNIITVFDPTQITSKQNRSNPQPGDPSHSLAAEAYAPAIIPTLLQSGSGTARVSDSEYGADFVVGSRPRRLTPRECERLQGFPDDWTRYGVDGEEMSDSARYRMIGDAVTVPVLEFIGKRIMQVEKDG